MQTTTHQCCSAIHDITRRLTLTDRHGTFYLRIGLVKYTLYYIHYFYNLTAFYAFYAVRITLHLPPDIRFLRRLKRDTTERGRTADSVMAQYVSTVRPFQQLHVEPSKQFADLIVSTQDFTRLTKAIVKLTAN